MTSDKCREAFEKRHIPYQKTPVDMRHGDGYSLPTLNALWVEWKEAWDACTKSEPCSDSQAKALLEGLVGSLVASNKHLRSALMAIRQAYGFGSSPGQSHAQKEALEDFVDEALREDLLSISDSEVDVEEGLEGQDALETAKSLLKQIEWRRGPFGNKCQFCEGINPEHTLFVKEARGHREDCPYAAFLIQCADLRRQ